MPTTDDKREASAYRELILNLNGGGTMDQQQEAGRIILALEGEKAALLKEMEQDQEEAEANIHHANEQIIALEAERDVLRERVAMLEEAITADHYKHDDDNPPSPSCGSDLCKALIKSRALAADDAKAKS